MTQADLLSDRAFREDVIHRLARIETHLESQPKRVDILERFRDRLTGGWLFVGGAVLLGNFALALIALFAR